MVAAIFLAVIWGWGFLTPSPVLAFPPVNESRVEQARQELGQENYEEALDLLTRAWQEGVRTPEAVFLLGRTYRYLLKYQEALQYLEEAVRLKPGYREAQLLLSDTLIGLDQPSRARPILLELEAAGFEPGHTSLLLGLAYYKEKNYAQAVNYFRKAQQDPNLAQDAKFQESMALAAQNRLSEAKKTMQEAISLNPQSPTAGFAQGYAAVLDRRLKDYQRFRFNVYTGFDFDSNVTLQPGDLTGAVFVSGKDDIFWSLGAALEYNVLPPGPWALWGFYGYYQNFHRRLTDFDLFSNTVGVVPAYTWSNSRFWMPFAFNYSDVGYTKYSTSYTLAPTYLYMFSPSVGLEMGLRLARRYYWFPLGFPQDDRSGRWLTGTMAAYYFIKNQQGYLQARFTYERDWTGGRNWDSYAYRFSLAVLYPVTKSLKFKGTADLIVQPYDNFWFNGNPFVTNPKRDDLIFIGGVEVTQKIYKGLEFNAHYYYVRDDSNINIYDYSRNIVGVTLGYRY